VCVYVVCGARGFSVDGDGEGVCVPHGVCVCTLCASVRLRGGERARWVSKVCVCACVILYYTCELTGEVQGVGVDAHGSARGEEHARGLVAIGVLGRRARGAARAEFVPRFVSELRFAHDAHGAGFIALGDVAEESSLAQAHAHAVDAEPEAEEHEPTFGHGAHF